MIAHAIRIRRWLYAALLIMAALPAHTAAQQCRGAGNWRGVAVSPTDITFSTPTIADFDSQGIIYASLVTLNVRSARQGTVPMAWSLCVNADTPALGSSQGVVKPLSDLQIDLMDGAWRPVTTSEQRIMTGNGDTVVQLRLRISLSWEDDRPGSFGTVLRFTVGN